MTYDVIIDNATIHDGTGRAPYRASLAVEAGRIAQIGRLEGADAARRIDGSGKVLCPGFIDVHSHADTVIHREDHERALEPLLRQGITTFVGGNCGMGLAPLRPQWRGAFVSYLEAFLGDAESDNITWQTTAELMQTLQDRGVVMNCALLAPHGVLRIAAMGFERGLCSREQMKAMKAMLAESLEAGVLGMSTGLQYYPGLCSDEDELVELASLLAEKDAVYASHIRSYTNTIDLAIDELISIGRRSGARVQLSHLFWAPHINLQVDRAIHAAVRLAAQVYKRVRVPLFPLELPLQRKLAALQRQIRTGLPLGIDAMPTGAGFTHAMAFFPPWTMEGSQQQVLARLADKRVRREIYRSIMGGRSVWPHRDRDTWSMNLFKVFGFRSVHLMSVVSDANQRYVGKHVVQIGKERGQHPFDAVCDMLLEERGHVLVFETPTWPGDEFAERSIHGCVTDPNVSFGTDAILIAHARPSHLFYDCFPRLLSKYVRKERLLTLAEAIRKATSLAAMQLGIRARGEIKRGYWADLVLLDPDRIDTRSTMYEPAAFPVGIDFVLVNGRVVVSPEGYHPHPRAGRVIRRGDA